MTTRTANPIHLHASPARAWKDALLVSFLAVLLGAFVANLVAPDRFIAPAPSRPAAEIRIAQAGLP